MLQNPAAILDSNGIWAPKPDICLLFSIKTDFEIFTSNAKKKINSNNNIILRIWLWRAVWMIKPQSDCTGLHRANIAWISSTNSFSLQLMFQLEITLSCFTFLLFFLWAFDNMLQNPVSSLGSERNKSLQAKGISRSQAWLFFCCCSLASQSIFDQIKE